MTRPRVEVRLATTAEFAQADGPLPFDRLDQVGPCLWLIAWDGALPVGHARVALDEQPELQNVWVSPERRRGGSQAHSRAPQSRRHVRADMTGCASL